MNRGGSAYFLTLLLTFSAGSLSDARGEPASARESQVVQTTQERKDRATDRAAISAFYAAAAELNGLLSRNRNTPQEPTLLLRLAEAYQKAASLEFRIAHANPIVDLTKRDTALNYSLVPLTRLLDLYNKHEDVPIAYFRRATSYKELGKKELAIQDFRILLDRYPNFIYAPIATLTLSDLLVDLKDFRTAIAYLTRLETSPGQRYFSLTMEKLAWSHYYLNEIPQALARLEAILSATYHKKQRSRAETAECEAAFSNIALYYMTGIETKQAGFVPESAYKYFRSLKVGLDLSKMTLPFALLLRTKGFDDALDEFKDAILDSELPSSDRIDHLLVALGNDLNKRRYPQFETAARQLSELWNTHRKELKTATRLQAKALKTLDEGAATLLRLFTKAQTAPGGKPVESAPGAGSATADTNSPTVASLEIAKALVSLFETTLVILPPEGSTGKSGPPGAREKIHYNLAEVSFQIRQFEKSIEHYHWVVTHSAPGSDFAIDAGAKEISARYEVLRMKGLIPGQLKAEPLQKAEKRKIPPETGEWLAMVQSAFKNLNSKRIPSIAVFAFEANRILYSLGYLQESLAGLLDFLRRAPSSTYAIPSAALVIDTYVASEDWPKANQQALQFLAEPAWKGNEFQSKLQKIAADTAFKILESDYRRGEFAGTLRGADAFFTTYPQSDRYRDALALAGNAALALKDKARAMTYFQAAVKSGAPPELTATALLTSASLAEDRLDFETASATYEQYLALKLPISERDKEERLSLRRKALLFAWISGNPTKLNRVIANPQVCGKGLEIECERLTIWGELTGRAAAPSMTRDESAGWGKVALESLNEAHASNKSYWAAIGIAHSGSLNTKDRTTLFSELVASWNKLDPLYRYTLIPILSESIPRALDQARLRVRSASPIQADPVSIKRRTKAIHALEGAFDQLSELPLEKIRVSVLNQNAQLYFDFVTDLTALTRTKGLSAENRAELVAAVDEIKEPLRKRGLELRKKAFELASTAAIENDVFGPLLTAYLAEFPEEAKALTEHHGKSNLSPDWVALLDTVDPGRGWVTPATNAAQNTDQNTNQNLAFRLKAEWMKALKQSNWAKVALLLESAGGTLSAHQIKLARSVSLISAGAQAEGIRGLEETIKILPETANPAPILTEIIAAYYASYSRQKTESLLADVKKLNRTPSSQTQSRVAEMQSWLQGVKQ